MRPAIEIGLPQRHKPAAVLPVNPPPVIDFIGDSHVARGLSSGIPPRNRTSSVQFSGWAWYVWASMLSKCGFVVGHVDGRSGAGTTELLAQYLKDLTTDPSPYRMGGGIRPGYCVIQIGTNAGNQSGTYDQIKIMVETLLRAGVEPILSTTPPKSSFQTDQLNNFYRLYAQQNGLKCLEIAGDPRLSDPSSGQWISGLSTDGIHCNDAGAKVFGQVVYEQFLAWRILTNVPMMPTRNGDGQLLTYSANGLMMTDTNADGVPDGFTLTGTGASCALTAVGSPNGLGNKATVTAGSATSTLRSNGTLVLPSSLCWASMRCEGTPASGGSITVRPFEQASATNMLDFTTTESIPAGCIFGGFVEANSGVPGGAPMQVYTSILATGSGGTVGMSQPAIYNLDAPVGQSIMPI